MESRRGFRAPNDPRLPSETNLEASNPYKRSHDWSLSTGSRDASSNILTHHRASAATPTRSSAYGLTPPNASELRVFNGYVCPDGYHMAQQYTPEPSCRVAPSYYQTAGPSYNFCNSQPLTSGLAAAGDYYPPSPSCLTAWPHSAKDYHDVAESYKVSLHEAQAELDEARNSIRELRDAFSSGPHTVERFQVLNKQVKELKAKLKSEEQAHEKATEQWDERTERELERQQVDNDVLTSALITMIKKLKHNPHDMPRPCVALDNYLRDEYEGVVDMWYDKAKKYWRDNGRLKSELAGLRKNMAEDARKHKQSAGVGTEEGRVRKKRKVRLTEPSTSTSQTQELCDHYLLGRCRKAEDCGYYHPEGAELHRLRAEMATELNQMCAK
ncbi:hypothetical protein K491DRAFT_713700 [Lophiostoma macrostomum CBS 122681]|uniref:C3H1-type domain-containing protein n=1 Tax=Lophiostoma macrostomum CBS 122681 TaxID=1314788 RepID=A0A6A6TF10_9PLEO|nr:hypothetical protein K491DRAFT_713700 [Lophiostoma macrostomum CBS 122681]